MHDILVLDADAMGIFPKQFWFETMPLRYQKALCYRQEKDRQLCLAAGLLFMAVMGIQNESVLQYGAFGKPYIPGKPHFNLSHGAGYAVLAFDENSIGIDIEPIDRSNLSIAELVFTSEEIKWMKENEVERFHALWTLKESAMKATGLGFNLPPASFNVLPIDERIPHRLHGSEWYSAFAAYNGCMIACTARHLLGKLNIRKLDALTLGKKIWQKGFDYA